MLRHSALWVRNFDKQKSLEREIGSAPLHPRLLLLIETDARRNSALAFAIKTDVWPSLACEWPQNGTDRGTWSCAGKVSSGFFYSLLHFELLRKSSLSRSWFWSWFKWSPVSPNKLRQAERKIFSGTKWLFVMWRVEAKTRVCYLYARYRIAPSVSFYDCFKFSFISLSHIFMAPISELI